MLASWTHQVTVAIAAPASAVFAAMADTMNWSRWNAGVVAIDLRGPFAAGTRFAMTLPQGDVIESMLTEVTVDCGFNDETEVEGTLVIVHHQIVPVGDSASEVTYLAVVSGPEAAAIGAAVTEDFDAVLNGLKGYVEGGARGRRR